MLLKERNVYFKSVNTLNSGLHETVTVVVDGRSSISFLIAGNAEILPSLSISYTSSQYLPASALFALHE